MEKARRSNDGQLVSLAALPKRCFVSHFYKDKAKVKLLLSLLPADIETLLFPRVEPTRATRSATRSFPRFSSAPGLIYLTGGASADSFWVSFERDYALRANREVFEFSPKSRQIRRDRSAPLPLNIDLVLHNSDEEGANRLLDWMARERHFNIDRSHLRSTFGGFTGDIMVILEQLLKEGGVILWLMGSRSCAVAEGFYSTDFLEYLREYGRFSDDELVDRLGT